MKQWIPAPASDRAISSGAVFGVSLDPGEQVRWAYTILPDGRRFVTGYDILPILPDASKRKRKAPARPHASLGKFGPQGRTCPEQRHGMAEGRPRSAKASRTRAVARYQRFSNS